MSEDWRKAFDRKQAKEEASTDDPTLSKIWREICLVGQGLGSGLKKGAIESYHHPLGTTVRVAEIAAINILLAGSHKGGLLGFSGKLLGAGFSLNLVNDLVIQRRWMPAWSAMEDTWHHSGRYEQNVRVMESSLGRFAFDSLLVVGSGLANPKLYELVGKKRAELATRTRIRRAFDPESTAVSADKFLETLDAKNEPAIRSDILGWIADRKPGLRPHALDKARATLPTDELGLPHALDIGAWSGEERKLLLSELRKMAGGDLATERNSAALVNLLKAHTRNWSSADLSGLRKQVLAANYDATVAAWQLEALARKDPALAQIDLHKLSEDWEGFRSRPALKESFDFAHSTHDAYLALYARLKPHYSDRGRAMEGALNELGVARGRPGVHLFVDDHLEARAMYFPGWGEIGTQGKDVVVPGLSPILVEKLMHEYTHFEQDVLSVRRLADELNIGKVPTLKEWGLLRNKYEALNKWDNCRLTAHFADDVLRHRNGKRLTAEELKRSLSLDDSVRNYLNSGAGEQLGRSTFDFQLLNSHKTSLDEPMRSLELAVRLVKGNDKSHELLLGSQSPIPVLRDVLVKAKEIQENPALMIDWNNEIATGALRDQIQIVAFNRWRDIQKPLSVYFVSKFEQEAWANGLLAQITARAMGLEAQPQLKSALTPVVPLRKQAWLGRSSAG